MKTEKEGTHVEKADCWTKLSGASDCALDLNLMMSFVSGPESFVGLNQGAAEFE